MHENPVRASEKALRHCFQTASIASLKRRRSLFFHQKYCFHPERENSYCILQSLPSPRKSFLLKKLVRKSKSIAATTTCARVTHTHTHKHISLSLPLSVSHSHVFFTYESFPLLSNCTDALYQSCDVIRRSANATSYRTFMFCDKRRLCADKHNLTSCFPFRYELATPFRYELTERYR
jgi:hypothetical protein